MPSIGLIGESSCCRACSKRGRCGGGYTKRQQETLQARLSEAPPSTGRLHPRLAELYAEKVLQLEEALNDPDIRDEAAEVLRSLIDRIEMHPGASGQSVDAMLHGDLAQILILCEGTDRSGKLPEAATSGSQLSVVAGPATSVVCTLTMPSYRLNAAPRGSVVEELIVLPDGMKPTL